MPTTIKEFMAYLREKDVQERQHVQAQLRVAAVSAEKLLGDPNWDRFQMHVQAWVNECEAARSMWMERCTMMGGEDLRLAQVSFAGCDARLRTLREVLDLPRAIMRDGMLDTTKDAERERGNEVA